MTPRHHQPDEIVIVRHALALLALNAAATQTADAQFGLTTLPLDDPAYVQLDALDRAGCAPASVSPNRPYEIRAIQAALMMARVDRYCRSPLLDALITRFALRTADTTAGFRAGGSVTLRATGLTKGELLPLWENIRPTGAQPPAVGLIEPQGMWGDGHHVVAVLDGVAQTSTLNDPSFPAGEYRQNKPGFDLRSVYVAAGTGAFSVNVGRDQQDWFGQSIESYGAPTAESPPVTRLTASVHTSHFEADLLYGLLNDVVLDSAQDHFASGIGPLHFYRGIAAHEFTWTPARVLQLTYGESVVFSRGARTFEFNYMNPFLPYLIIQHDTGRIGDDARDNLNVFASMRLRLGPVSLSESLDIDDIQIDAADRAKTPDQLGWRVAADAPLPLSSMLPADVELEYRHDDTFLDMRRYYTEVQQYWDEPIWEDLGPDADYVRLAIEAIPSGVLRLAGDLGLWRRGLMRIYMRPAVSPVDAGHPPFPSHLPGRPVQTAYIGNVAAQLLNPIAPLTVHLAAARVTNANNLPSSPGIYLQVQVIASYALHYP